MSNYLIQDTTLDAIADAINAKTGGSSAMTPAQMVTAIGSISGGGGMSWELIADYTSDEDAAVVVATIPEGKQNANVYKVEYSNTNSGGIGYYPRMQVNGVVSGYGSNSSTPGTGTGYISRRVPKSLNGIGDRVLFGNGDVLTSALYPITQIGVNSYGENNVIKAGTRVKIWRLVES